MLIRFECEQFQRKEKNYASLTGKRSEFKIGHFEKGSTLLVKSLKGLLCKFLEMFSSS